MLTKRIIPCLDVKDGKTVKGINFENLRDAGDPVALAHKYAVQGADELVFLDITATQEKRKTLVQLVDAVAQKINIPFTVGGGIASVEDARAVLNAGADKVAINSAALKRVGLISELASAFGNQCVVLAVDAKWVNGEWIVYRSGGKIETKWNLFDWVKTGVENGAGEILFTSMNGDGTKQGFANQALAKLSTLVNVPIIASGGAGEIVHFETVFLEGNADAALAASIFHFDELTIPNLKEALNNKNIPIRL